MRVRYVAGLGPNGDDEMAYSVVRLIEGEDGERLASPTIVISDMNPEQTEHLWMQLGKALGQREAFATEEHPKIRALRQALDAHRQRHGVEVEVNAEGGWRDVRDYLP